MSRADVCWQRVGEPPGGMDLSGELLRALPLHGLPVWDSPAPQLGPRPAHLHAVPVWERWTQIWTKHVKTSLPEAGGLFHIHTCHSSN